MKKLITLMAIIITLTTVTVPVSASDRYYLVIDGEVYTGYQTWIDGEIYLDNYDFTMFLEDIKVIQIGYTSLLDRDLIKLTDLTTHVKNNMKESKESESTIEKLKKINDELILSNELFSEALGKEKTKSIKNSIAEAAHNAIEEGTSVSEAIHVVKELSELEILQSQKNTLMNENVELAKALGLEVKSSKSNVYRLTEIYDGIEIAIHPHCLLTMEVFYQTYEEEEEEGNIEIDGSDEAGYVNPITGEVEDGIRDSVWNDLDEVPHWLDKKLDTERKQAIKLIKASR